jgi:serine/threonine protein kinase
MEYCGGGDLSHLIRECERTHQNFPEDTIWSYFCQIVQALGHCHSTGDEGEDGNGGRVTPGGSRRTGKERERVLHRDLKPDNGQFTDTSSFLVGLSEAARERSGRD